MPTIDTRPTKLDIAARTGDARTLRLTFPADYLDDHASWAASFGGETVTPVIAGDVMTITVTAAITAELGNGRHLWTLTDSVVDQTRIAGRLLLGDDATESSDTTVDVTIADIVDVTIEVLGGGGGVTNLAYTASATQGVVTSDTGTDATVPAATGTNAGLMLPAEKTKLAAIEAGAQVNEVTQAELDAETAARAAADSSLDGRLDTIEAISIATDAELAAAVAAEASTRASADTALDARLDVIEALGPLATDAEVSAAIAALSGTYAPLVQRPNTIVLFGDSITARNTDSDATSIGWSTRGYFTWANAMLGQRFDVLANSGISGNWTADLLARIQTDVIAYAPGWCIVEAGINDCSNGIAAATIQTNLTAIYEALRLANIKVIATTITPNSGLTSGQEDVRSTVNQWLREYCRAHGILLCDFSAAVTDNTTPTWATGLAVDGLHPDHAGAARCGRRLFELLESMVPMFDALPSSPTASTNLLTNGFTTGSSGGVATGWSTSGTLTASKVARTDQSPGEWQQIATASATSAAFYRDYSSPVVGGVYELLCEFESDPFTSYTEMRLLVQARNGGGTVLLQAMNFFNPTFGSALPLENQIRSGVLRTYRLTVPANTATLRCMIQLIGQGTFRATRFALRRVS